MIVIKNKKYLYGIGGVLLVSAIYYTYNYFRLRSIYNKEVTLAQAENDIKNPQTPLIKLPDKDLDEAINNAVNEDGNLYSGNDDLPDTAVIGVIKYTLEDNGTYTSTDGSNIVYVPKDRSVYMPDGSVTIIDDAMVTYSNSGNP
jgi:hypothetical protein